MTRNNLVLSYEAVSKGLNLKKAQNNIWFRWSLWIFCALCGKKLNTKYEWKAQSNTEFLFSKIKSCSDSCDFTFDTASLY
jgi:hypothetical protein